MLSCCLKPHTTHLAFHLQMCPSGSLFSLNTHYHLVYSEMVGQQNLRYYFRATSHILPEWLVFSYFNKCHFVLLEEFEAHKGKVYNLLLNVVKGRITNILVFLCGYSEGLVH